MMVNFSSLLFSSGFQLLDRIAFGLILNYCSVLLVVVWDLNDLPWSTSSPRRKFDRSRASRRDFKRPLSPASGLGMCGLGVWGWSLESVRKRDRVCGVLNFKALEAAYVRFWCGGLCAI
jgi:hypothetical protein